MSKNGMASFGRVPNYVSLTHLPTPKREYVTTFQNLYGGLNTFELDYMLKKNESPDLVNMQWADGSLGCRPGQAWVDDEKRGRGHAISPSVYYGSAFAHIGTKLYRWEVGGADGFVEAADLAGMKHGGDADERGTFFRYQEHLLYKAPGLFIRITYSDGSFTVTDVCEEAYTPITVINADWRNGAGDLYQPENRLSGAKTVWYNAGLDNGEVTFSGDGQSVSFALSSIEGFHAVTDVSVNGASTAGWYVTGGALVFYKAPDAGDKNIRVSYTAEVKTYTLPVHPVDYIESVTVDGVTLGTSAYSVDLASGVVTLAESATVTTPFTGNTVRITYKKANDDAFNSVMDCPYAIVYGGNQNICIVAAGCKAQPNAFFWNGNNIAMDESYWPMEQYNLGGDTEDPITGFGRQQGYLVIFKDHSIGKGEMTFTTLDLNAVNARKVIEIDYTSINAKVGCDLPWTIQLVENNLVFCNTEQGIHFIRDSSAAYENNIIGISRKVNGTPARSGILAKIRGLNSPADVIGFDDDERYWLVIGSDVYVWDYIVSTQDDPSFFYYTNIRGRGFLRGEDRTIYHLDPDGRLTRLAPGLCMDYGKAIYKRYVFPAQFFDSYDRLKDVTRCIFSVRPTGSTKLRITYRTDHEERTDLTDVNVMTWALVPRNLALRNLASTRFAEVAIRRPGCRHVRHFQMMLENDEPGRDMGVTFAQLFYKYQGRDR